MKRALVFIIFASAITLASVSCNQKEYPSPQVYYDATVTFRPNGDDGAYFLKQDDSTALIVKNTGLEKYPFADGKEKRAIISYYIKNTSSEHIAGFKTTYDVQLYRIDTIYTKAPVLLNEGDNPDVYGTDPVGIYFDKHLFPTTMVEDGYLCVCFEMPGSYSGIAHSIELVRPDPEDPYTLELRHDMKGDIATTSVTYFVNFPLKDLPDTQGKTETLTLKWYSLASGATESESFKYKSRTDW